VRRLWTRSFLLGLLPLFVLAHFGHHLVSGMLTPLLPFIRDDLVLDYTQSGWLVSAYTIAYGVSQLPAGWLADRIGYRMVVAIGVSGVALFGLLFGVSTTFIMMVAFLVLLGVMGGGYHPAAAPLVSAGVEPKNRGSALGLHQIGGSVSFFLAPLIAVGIAAALGWRGSFITVAIPTIILGIVFYVLLGRLGYTRKAEQRILSECTEVHAAPGHLRRLTAFVALGIAGQTFIVSIMSFIPLFFVGRLGVSREAAGALLAVVYSGGLWAGPLGGFLSDRIGKTPVMLVFSLIAAPVVYLMNSTPFGWSMSAVLIVIGMSAFLVIPVTESFIISQTSERNRSTVLGIYYAGSRGGAGVITPVLGYLIDHQGFYSSFTIMSVAFFVITLVCAIFLWRSRD